MVPEHNPRDKEKTKLTKERQTFIDRPEAVGSALDEFDRRMENLYHGKRRKPKGKGFKGRIQMKMVSPGHVAIRDKKTKTVIYR